VSLQNKPYQMLSLDLGRVGLVQIVVLFKN